MTPFRVFRVVLLGWRVSRLWFFVGLVHEDLHGFRDFAGAFSVGRFFVSVELVMPCYKPFSAWQPLEGGQLVFSERKGCREILLACGQCIGCRIKKQNGWAVRAMCESQMHDQSWFITWTYADEHLPQYGSLNYRDVVLLNKRLRKKFGSFRFFVAGEYGDSFGRCHWHSLNFGLRLPDLDFATGSGGKPIYRSKSLEDCWGKGFVYIGLVTPASARYCATYTVKRITGARAEEHYSRVIPETGEIVQVQPEMARMSLNPGLGATWLDKYWREVVTHDGVVSDGRINPMPRYFDRRIRAFDDDVLVSSIEAKLDVKRAEFADANAWDCTPERLLVREQCTLARVKFHGER